MPGEFFIDFRMAGNGLFLMSPGIHINIVFGSVPFKKTTCLRENIDQFFPLHSATSLIW